MIQSGAATARHVAPPAGSPRSWSSTTVMVDLVDERVDGGHGRFGVLDVHVVTGARHSHVARPQPSDSFGFFLGTEIAPRVVLGPGDDEHRALHAALLFGEEPDVELARHAEPEHRIRLPHPSP